MSDVDPTDLEAVGTIANKVLYAIGNRGEVSDRLTVANRLLRGDDGCQRFAIGVLTSIAQSPEHEDCWRVAAANELLDHVSLQRARAEMAAACMARNHNESGALMSGVGKTIAEAREKAPRYTKDDVDRAWSSGWRRAYDHASARGEHNGRRIGRAMAFLDDVKRGQERTTPNTEAARVEREMETLRDALAMLESYQKASGDVRKLFADCVAKTR